MNTNPCLMPSGGKKDPSSRVVSSAQWGLTSTEPRYGMAVQILYIKWKRGAFMSHFPSILKHLVSESKLLSCHRAAPLRKSDEVPPFTQAQLSCHMQSARWEGKGISPYHCKPEPVPCVHLHRRTLEGLQTSACLESAISGCQTRATFKLQRTYFLCCINSYNTEPCFSACDQATISQVNILLKVSIWS